MLQLNTWVSSLFVVGMWTMSIPLLSSSAPLLSYLILSKLKAEEKQIQLALHWEDTSSMIYSRVQTSSILYVLHQLYLQYISPPDPWINTSKSMEVHIGASPHAPKSRNIKSSICQFHQLPNNFCPRIMLDIFVDLLCRVSPLRSRIHHACCSHLHSYI